MINNWKLNVKQVVFDQVAISAVDETVSPPTKLSADKVQLRLQLAAEQTGADFKLTVTDAAFSLADLALASGAQTPFKLAQLGFTALAALMINVFYSCRAICSAGPCPPPNSQSTCKRMQSRRARGEYSYPRESVKPAASLRNATLVAPRSREARMTIEHNHRKYKPMGFESPPASGQAHQSPRSSIHIPRALHGCAVRIGARHATRGQALPRA